MTAKHNGKLMFGLIVILSAHMETEVVLIKKHKFVPPGQIVIILVFIECRGHTSAEE